MESVEECRERDVSAKQMPQDPSKDEVVKVLNGDVNGSYEEFGSSDEQIENVSDCHTNGEIPSSLKVPSHENGVEKVTFDHSVQDQDELMETEDAEEENSSTTEEAVSANDEVSSAVDEASNLVKETSSDEQEVSSAAQVGKEPVIEKMCTEVDSELVRSESELNEKVDNGPSELVVSSTHNKPTSSSSENTETKRELSVNIGGISVNTPYSKELEDLTKISARGSLEITIVKKPIESNDKSKENSKADEDKNKDVDVVTITGGPSNKEPLDLKTPDKKRERDEDDDDDSVVEITPEKSSKKKKVQPITNITPRRSSRNLNKTKSYADKDVYIEELDKKSDDDVEEIIPTDPLADDRKKIPKKTTIVVNDTKKLVEIASGSKQARGSKKEPTLVIIDTNSILSGKGAVPVSQHTSLPQMSVTASSRGGFSMLPVGTSSFQPKGVKPSLVSTQHQAAALAAQQQQAQPKPIILPSLTDDMYVVEAPSFIVPYVYEKPPVTSLKEFVTDMEKVIKEQEKEEKKKKKEKEAQEKSAQETSKTVNEDEKEDRDQEMDKKDSDVAAEKKEASETIEDKPLKEAEEAESEEKNSNEEKTRSEGKSDTETDDEGKDSDSSSKKDSDSIEIVADGKKKSESYFENALGKFFMQIGVNLVQEHVQTDLLRNQKRKRDRDGKNCPPDVHMAITSLLRTLEFSKETNKHYKLEMQKCKLCNFKTESELVMAHHLETPHMRNYVYRCNFCTLEVRSPHDILFHMEAEHNVRGRLERAPAFHQCPNCPFEDNQKGKLSRHLLSCAKKYKPERNQEPPLDWEPPAKIPRVRGARSALTGGSLYQPTLAPRGAVPMGRLATPSGQSLLAPRGRGRPPIYINRAGLPAEGRSSPHHNKALAQMRPGNSSGDPRDVRGSILLQYPYQETLRGMVFRPSGSNAQPQVLLPTPYQMGNSLYPKGPSAAAVAANATAKLLQQPSISITPLPRQPTAPPVQQPSPQSHLAKPGRPPGSAKTTFVICEICDGYIKDLEQLRNHMQWIHKVKIHPKMIYNRPPLNCQKCQFRFFTDQGLERHLLGSHGLVTSSMQEAANKGKDGGRCPVCGRVYQWKLLNHVARDHNMSLKPAHLSYKCTVCTATFGMYKQFENHVYSAHSVVAKRVMDKKPSSASQPSTSGTSQSDSLLKPLKINDEITIIPQPSARTKTKSQTIPSKSSKM
ncbi:zinc finger protein MEP-1 isoform X2 [Rhodnius prolixus]|uniref:zinc finger protein MEP-1 isoform X2 n=1 Tax=Rhodnius prolixus TaxID=13249 RepID=UPI003D18CA21